jgi:methylglyoxal reductase
MHYQPLGPSGLQASIIGSGTWASGGWMWGGTDESEAIQAIQASIEAGVTLVDTAPAYGLGRSEEIVGKAIAGRREKVILATKCGLVWHTAKGQYFFEQAGRPVHRYLGPESVRYELEQSLQRLGTNYIDLYQTHWQDPTTPIAETMGTLLELKREGKIRAIGVSNISLAELAVYQEIGPVDIAQEKFSMLDRQIEAELLPYCREHGIGLLAYSPLALGLLTGKIGPDRHFSGDDQRLDNPRFSVENRQKVADMLQAFSPIAQHHEVTMAQLVIAWTAAQPGVTHVLCGARNARQSLENARAGTIVLSDHELETMNKIIQHYAGGIP